MHLYDQREQIRRTPTANEAPQGAGTPPGFPRAPAFEIHGLDPVRPEQPYAIDWGKPDCSSLDTSLAATFQRVIDEYDELGALLSRSPGRAPVRGRRRPRGSPGRTLLWISDLRPRARASPATRAASHGSATSTRKQLRRAARAATASDATRSPRAWSTRSPVATLAEIARPRRRLVSPPARRVMGLHSTRAALLWPLVRGGESGPDPSARSSSGAALARRTRNRPGPRREFRFFFAQTADDSEIILRAGRARRSSSRPRARSARARRVPRRREPGEQAELRAALEERLRALTGRAGSRESDVPEERDGAEPRDLGHARQAMRVLNRRVLGPRRPPVTERSRGSTAAELPARRGRLPRGPTGALPAWCS